MYGIGEKNDIGIADGSTTTMCGKAGMPKEQPKQSSSIARIRRVNIQQAAQRSAVAGWPGDVIFSTVSRCREVACFRQAGRAGSGQRRISPAVLKRRRPATLPCDAWSGRVPGQQHCPPHRIGLELYGLATLRGEKACCPYHRLEDKARYILIQRHKDSFSTSVQTRKLMSL